jgi:ribosomal-protein-alanine N-acetyltransferase
MKIPLVDTPRLRLRGFEDSDLESLWSIVRDRQVIRYLPATEPWPRQRVLDSLERHWAHWEKHGFGWWAVETRTAKELIGWCGLGFLEDTDEVEIKYLLKRSHWGKGLATEAAKPCIEHAFSTLALEQVIGLVHPENNPSSRVLEKLGLHFSNTAQYFGIDVRRYTMDKERFLIKFST